MFARFPIQERHVCPIAGGQFYVFEEAKLTRLIDDGCNGRKHTATRT